MRALTRLAPLLLIGCTIDNPLFGLDPTGTPGTPGPTGGTSSSSGSTLEPTTQSPTTDTTAPTAAASTAQVEPDTTGEPGSTTTANATTDQTTGPDECGFAGGLPVDPQIYVDLDPLTPMTGCAQPAFVIKGELSMQGGALKIHQTDSCVAPKDGPDYYFGLGYPADDRSVGCVEIEATLAAPLADCRVGALKIRNPVNNKQVYLAVFDQPTPGGFPLQPTLVDYTPCECEQSPCCDPFDPGQYSLSLFGTTIAAGETVMMTRMNHTGLFHNFRSHVTPECERDPSAAYQVAWFAEVL